MFTKILIANRGDKCRAAALAAQAHGDVAAVMPKPNRLGRAAAGDRAAGA
ncbi:MAG TPA: hypothetical protein VFK10_00780 [Burkholderiaceae bacterium]|nr:hypothetical protein [Burkholderiaceae bacterium]